MTQQLVAPELVDEGVTAEHPLLGIRKSAIHALEL
jgi:hypothetical protein